MGKRFVIKGENPEKILIGIELSSTDTSLQLFIFDRKKGIKDALKQWENYQAELPENAEIIKRTIADQHLLPEEIKVKNVGKVRLIENKWAELLIQTRLLQSFDSELNVLQESVAQLDDYSEKLFQECSDFWKRLLEFKRENKSVDDQRIDAYKMQIDILFEALKALRKDHKKELDHKSIENKAYLDEQLDQAEKQFTKDGKTKTLAENLKRIRKEYLNRPMRHAHKDEIDNRINQLFEKISEQRQQRKSANADKRINDLEGIITKMNKALDWKLRELQREEKNLQFADHAFQEKLLLSKIEMIKKDISQLEKKITDVKATLEQVKKN